MFSKCIWCSSNACCRVTNLSCSFCRVSIRSGRKVSALQNLAVYVSQTLNSQKTKRSQGQSAVSARVVKKSTRSYEKSPTDHGNEVTWVYEKGLKFHPESLQEEKWRSQRTESSSVNCEFLASRTTGNKKYSFARRPKYKGNCNGYIE